MTPEVTQEIIKWLVFVVPVIVMVVVVGPEALKCWKMHMHYKARKQQMDFEHEVILKILKHQKGTGDD